MAVPIHIFADKYIIHLYQNLGHLYIYFASMIGDTTQASGIVRMCDLTFDKSLFVNFDTHTVLDRLLCSYSGLPKGVNYMIIGDPGSGKTTIILDMLANIMRYYPQSRILFVSAEMNEIDLAVYVQRYPKFQYINIMFIESDFSESETSHNLSAVESVLQQGWDIVAIDSFYELQGIIKEEENMRMKEAENRLLAIIKRNNKAQNQRGVNTTFLTIQQVTKSGNFIGSNRLKHSITAMMELRFENPKNVFSDRYVVFSKHRRGDVGVRLYYDLSATGDVHFDEERFEKDARIRKMQAEVSNNLRQYADRFDELFSNQQNTQQ